ncbi:methyltransferase [Nitrospira sp.]|nr:methyltransferase [Nitrospira sp.]
MTQNKPSRTADRTNVPCIVCNRSTVDEFMDLGATALANKFLSEAELDRPEPKFPLKVGFCHTCGHVQLTEAVPPHAMFQDYLYVSSASDTLKRHLYELSDTLVARRGLGPADLVIDIGCNDGTLLSGFARHGVRTLGVDPAENLAALTANSNLNRYVGFFNAKTAQEIVNRWGRASLITATNTFPHIPELRDFVEGINKALAPGGAFVIEAHYVVDMLDQGAFDTVYHEHISYWALGPMTRLFQDHSMQVVDAERIPLHHGQLRVTVQRQGEGKPAPRVAEILQMEHDLGLDTLAPYVRFAGKTEAIKETVRHTLTDLVAKGKRVVGYGAPAKGNTLLSFLDLGPSLIPYIVDRSSLKQGRYTPGAHIPVVAPSRLLEDQPDYVLVLAWNFLEEVMEQQAEYRRRGGQFIVPVPEVRILA